MCKRTIFTACLALTLIILAASLIRWPMMVYAYKHLDSDLAVDGLTLRDFVQNGNWRWHYPGTPHIGTLPVLISLPAVALWGEGPASLVFAGIAANILLILAIYLLVNRAYGTVPAILASLVLAAGGLGQVWLSARVTGGHLLSAAWLAWAWLFWTHLIDTKSLKSWAGLGLFCAIGIWIDSIFLLGIAGLGLSSVIISWQFRSTIPIKRRSIQALVFTAFLPIGPLISKLGDGVNVYGSQFEITTDPSALKEHARILLVECLPRLIIGRTLKTGSTEISMTHLKPADYLSSNYALAMVLTMMAVLFIMTWLKLISPLTSKKSSKTSSDSLPDWVNALWYGLTFTVLLTLSAFELNKNIFNADNYRYLVPLIPLLGMTYGLLSSAGPMFRQRRFLLILLTLILAIDVHFWQQVNGFYPSLQTNTDKKLETYTNKDVVSLLTDPQPGPLPAITDTFEADYWETYRALYLAQRPISMGKPFGFFPNRFPNESPPNPRFVLITNSPASLQMLPLIRAEGAKLFSDKRIMVYDRSIRESPTPPPISN